MLITSLILQPRAICNWQLDIFKMEDFCWAKLRLRENVCTRHPATGSLGTHKELWKLNKKTKHNFQMGKDLNKHLTKEDTQMANKLHIQRCSAPRVILDLKLQPWTIATHLLKRPRSEPCCRRKAAAPFSRAGERALRGRYGSFLHDSTTLTTHPAIALLVSARLRWKLASAQKPACGCHSSSIHSHLPKLEATKVPSLDEWANWYI